MTVVVGRTDMPLERVRRGKVRDVYAVDADRLLLVASDVHRSPPTARREPVMRSKASR